MSERYTSDLPAVPDPDYEYINPEHERDIFDRLFEEGSEDEIPTTVRGIYRHMLEAKQSKTPLRYDNKTEKLFEFTAAQGFIDGWAVYDDDGRLNMDLTSEKIGIPYDFEINSQFAHGEITGLPGPGRPLPEQPVEIHLDRKRRLFQATYGHEIGHYFMRAVKAYNVQGWNRLEEDFCDYFGRRMAMPIKHLGEFVTDQRPVDEQAILELMGRFQMELVDVITGLMEYGILPSRVAIDTYYGRAKNEDYSQKVTRGVYCLHCMQVGGDYNCPTVNQPTPLFDFTDRAWGGQMWSCLGEDLHKPPILSTLTKYYVANEAQLVLFRPGALYEHDDEDQAVTKAVRISYR